MTAVASTCRSVVSAIVFLVLSLFVMTRPLSLYGDVPVGEWRYYNNYGLGTCKVIDSKDKVYYVCDRNLYAYDKKSGETYGYHPLNGLSDVSVDDIFYDNLHRQLVVLYDNGNIDVITDTGDIVNIGDIKDASHIVDRSLNDVAFSGRDCYVACNFGIVSIDLEDFLVKESAVFNRPVTAIAVIDGKLVVSVDGRLMYRPDDVRLSDIDRYVVLDQSGAVSMEAVSDRLLIATDGKVSYSVELDFAEGRAVRKRIAVASDYVMICDGKALLANRDEYGIVDASGTVKTYKIPENVRKHGNTRCHSITSDGSMWYINTCGLGHFTAEGVVDSSPVRPQATFLDTGAWYITADPLNDRIYVSNRSSRNDLRFYNENGPMTLTGIEAGFPRDITPASDEVTLRNPNSGGRLKTGFNMAVDRKEEGVIYIGTWYEGIFRFKDGKQTDKYDWTNMPAELDYILAFPAVAIDSQNNLWCYGYNAKGAVTVAVLPDSRRTPGSVTAADWIVLDIDGFGSFDARNTIILPCMSPQNKDIVLISDGYRDHNLVTYHTGSGIESISDDRYNVRNLFYDQDGKPFGPACIFSMAEDKSGAVWVGTDDGVFVIRDPADMLDENCRIERVKVPRNDGTSYADYLLGNMSVTAVSVDGSNRKWFGTNSSGVYVVSADGKEILDNFNTSNGFLPSDEVLSLLCDPHGNSVYIGTRAGVVEYGCDALPAAEDYSEISAYPNPVRPGYAGDVIIKGLKENSLVKIADAAGNVFYQTRSQGGMARWNVASSSGRRAATGVYYVLVSSADSRHDSVVTKILVVN